MRTYYRILCAGLIIAVATVPSLMGQSSGSGSSSANSGVSSSTEGHTASSSSTLLSSSSVSHATLRAVPPSLHFGFVPVGETAYDTIQLMLDEDSDAPLYGSVQPKSGTFAIVSGDGSFLLKPGEKRTLVIAFTPSQVHDPSLLHELRDFIGVFHYGSTVAGRTLMTIHVSGLGSPQVVSSVQENGSANSIVSAATILPNVVEKGTRPRLTFSLAKSSPVEVSLVAVDGSVVELVAEQEMEAGEHQVELDLQSIPASGVYYVRVLSGGPPIYRSIFITK